MKSLETFITTHFTDIILAFSISWVLLVAYGLVMS